MQKYVYATIVTKTPSEKLKANDLLTIFDAQKIDNYNEKAIPSGAKIATSFMAITSIFGIALNCNRNKQPNKRNRM